MSIAIVVGLGNPGRVYAHTRHNVGVDAVQHMASVWGIPLTDKNRYSILGHGNISGHPITLAKLRSFMNESGKPISYILNRYNIPISKLLVLYDDMDLPLGTIRIRPDGGPGGHRGMLSIVDTLGSKEFPRLRVGVGRPIESYTDKEYVLDVFSGKEKPVIENTKERVSQAVQCILSYGIKPAMDQFNAQYDGQV